MRSLLVRLLCISIILSVLLAPIGDVANTDASQTPIEGLTVKDAKGVGQLPARRVLSHPAQISKVDTALVATLDGTIHLLELSSMKTLWSFATGPPIYSSYHAPLNHSGEGKVSGSESDFYIDCGDDWALYVHHRLGKQKLSDDVGHFISSSTPRIFKDEVEDGAVMLGSKRTTAFQIDVRTGRVIYTYSMSNDSPPGSQSNEEKSISTIIEEQGRYGSIESKTNELPLYITRTDYALTSFHQKSNKLLWNMTVSEFSADFICKDDENSLDGAILDSGPSETGYHFNMPLPCQSRAKLPRLRKDIPLPLLKLNSLENAQHADKMLTAPTSNDLLPVQPNTDILLRYHQNKEKPIVAPNLFVPSPVNAYEFKDSSHRKNGEIVISSPEPAKNSGTSGIQDVKMPHNDGVHLLLKGFSVSSVIAFISILVGFVGCGYFLVVRKRVGLTTQLHSANTRSEPSKRKKSRKYGKNNVVAEKKDEQSSFDLDNKNIESNDMSWFSLKQPTDGGKVGRMIGKLLVTTKEIAKGSNGTIVLEGTCEGRPVAVKRLVKVHHDIAFKEIQNLIASDHHPNIVRWFGVEHDQDFVYVSLERCACSLNDLIEMYSDSHENPIFTRDSDAEAMMEYKARLDSMKSGMQDVELWKKNSRPSPLLLKLMRDMVSGLVHLHELGIIHRDLKPQNVLIIKDRYSLCAKLSDMGVSKRLSGDVSSLSHHATGCGSSGWQAPEQLLHGRQTRAVDLFGLGCVLFFCLTGGKHPFGNRYERDVNIVKNELDLFLVEHIPEAFDLLSRLLHPNAEMRPKALEVLHHPLFWSPEKRLSFLRDTSDKVELEDRETNSDILNALESIAPMALGGKWDEKMDPAFINNVGRYRRYKYESVRDLLRVMRNKLSHYRELPVEIQEILGPVPEGFDGYFMSRFPKLLIEVHKVMYKFCGEEDFFHKYFKGNDT